MGLIGFVSVLLGLAFVVIIFATGPLGGNKATACIESSARIGIFELAECRVEVFESVEPQCEVVAEVPSPPCMMVAARHQRPIANHILKP